MIVMKTKKKKDTMWQTCRIKRKLKFEDYNHCLVATERENKINHLGNHKEFIKYNKLILKSQKIYKWKKNVFNGKVNRITLSTNDDKKYNH